MDKLLSMLGLARRGGKLAVGYDTVVETVREGEAKLLLAARDVSAKTYKNLMYEATRKNVPCVRIDADMIELGHACKIRAGVLAIIDEGFANALLKVTQAVTNEKEDNAV